MFRLSVLFIMKFLTCDSGATFSVELLPMEEFVTRVKSFRVAAKTPVNH